MPTTVQARLDDKAEAALRRIARVEGWTTSEVIRMCILEGAERRAAKPRPRLIGAGCFDSGVTDLATNKKHMEGFGKKWRVDKRGKGRWDW
jgi:hypothetical protein